MSARTLLAAPALSALSLWRRLAPPDPAAFRILLFHDVAPAQRDSFAALLDDLADRCGFITPAEAEARLAGEAGGGRAPCLVTFDDGFASNHDVAESVLAHRGIRAVFFVCPGLIDLPAARQQAAAARAFFSGHDDPAATAARTPLMGWDQIADLAARGHAIGAHSMSHRRLAGLEAAALEDEVGTSGARIAAVVGDAPRWFAWPYGDMESIDRQALTAIARRYGFCRSGVRGFNGPGVHRLAVRADHVDLAAPVAWQKLAALGGLDGRYVAARDRLDRLAGAVAQHAAP